MFSIFHEIFASTDLANFSFVIMFHHVSFCYHSFQMWTFLPFFFSFINTYINKICFAFTVFVVWSLHKESFFAAYIIPHLQILKETKIPKRKNKETRIPILNLKAPCERHVQKIWHVTKIVTVFQIFIQKSLVNCPIRNIFG